MARKTELCLPRDCHRARGPRGSPRRRGARLLTFGVREADTGYRAAGPPRGSAMVPAGGAPQTAEGDTLPPGHPGTWWGRPAVSRAGTGRGSCAQCGVQGPPTSAREGRTAWQEGGHPRPAGLAHEDLRDQAAQQRRRHQSAGFPARPSSPAFPTTRTCAAARPAQMLLGPCAKGCRRGPRDH